MRTIYIRHADKDFNNGNSEYFKHDPGITETGVDRAKNIGMKLIKLYGEPTKIISSPYRRARETSLIMNNVLKNPLDEIVIETDISEYLGNHNDVPLDVTIATKIHCPPHPETFEHMKKRVKKYLEKNNKKEGIVWVITHGLIIKQIALSYKIKTSKQLPYLTSFSVVEHKDLIRAEFILFRNFLKNEEVENKPIYKVKKPFIERFLISPENTGRDDMSGRIN